MAYSAIKDRYDKLQYRRCGNSGLQLPSITLGLWHNFGGSKLANESKLISDQIIDSLGVIEIVNILESNF